jgi:hypothetical protein
MNVVCQCGSDNVAFRFGPLSQPITGWECQSCGHRQGHGDSWLPPDSMTGVALIAEERRRQVQDEGWSPAHDDTHDDGELVDAAYCVLYEHAQGPGCVDDDDEPDGWEQALALKMRHADPIRRLVVVGALVAAEIDRLRRREAQSPSASEAPSPVSGSTHPEGNHE